MWIKEKRDQLKAVVAKVQDRAYWSNCNAEVLYGVAVLCADGARALGHNGVRNPPKNRERQFYKDWIVQLTHRVWWWLNDWEFLDCTLDKATKDFDKALEQLEDCRVAADEIESDEPVG